MKSYTKQQVILFLAVAILLSSLLQLACYRLDNKYTFVRPAAEKGLIRLDMEWYDSNPLFYLVEGWAFYDGKLLTPGDISAYTPDDYFYIGRYGGLNRGDMTRSAAGQATYRLVIETDDTLRTFSLELGGVYDRCRLWVNGVLLQSVGYDGDSALAGEGAVVTFIAAKEIELVVAVESEGNGFYSGMVYPPALGSRDSVGFIAALRLLIHGFACTVAFLVCVLCLILAIGKRKVTLYGYLSLLCLGFCGTAAWPVYQYFGLTGGFLVWERVCYYSIFFSLILVQNRICSVPKPVAFISGTVGMSICIAVAVRPIISFSTAAVNLLWSQALGAYKWLTAGYLVLCTVWALCKDTRYSVPLLAGNCAFAAVLVVNRLLPMHEPILLGGNVELAGFWWIGLLTGIIGHDAVHTYREREYLIRKQAISEMQLAAQSRHAREQQEYVRMTRERLHESRSRLTLIRHYLNEGMYDTLKSYLDQLSADTTGLDAMMYTGNSLVDAILTLQLSRTEKIGAYAEKIFSPLSEELPIEDADMTGLLMNIMDNALEALERISEPDDRWLRLCLEQKEDMLLIECENATVPGERQAVKPDRQAHGFGIPFIRSVTAKYGGKLVTERQEDSFLISVTFPAASKDA